MTRWRGCEIVLFLGGILLLGAALRNLASYAAFQSHPEWFVTLPVANNLPEQQAAAVPKVAGRLEIPRLRMSVLVVEGGDDESLRLAAGHVPDTAPLGASGNAVIAGHRDIAFRPLRKIKIGDRIRIRTDKVYLYTVRELKIVDPEDLSVLQNIGQPMLTLVTCYPFRYLGNAPKRFIVQAETAPSSLRMRR